MDSLSPESVAATFARGAAADLRWLARLHDREPTAALLAELAAAPPAECLALRLDGEDAARGFDLLARTLAEPVTPALLEELAVDFAAIHLNHTYRAAPIESVWVHDEPLVRQEAMFAVKRWHRRAGVEPADDQRRDPDHLVLELHFLAVLCERAGDDAAALDDVVAFLDEHPLRWVPAFCGRVATRCATPFFAGAALLTGAYLERLRTVLGAALGRPRPAACDEKVSSRSDRPCG
ncbi:TorD/DmsD family molecular chaperone [Azospirillum halopraeferens]|uniref:TorD/DmsD family molecular chaperone n=1 Tax=Azospirillum halopraeferens TaxID=34010 RepID=UPI000403C7D5|nr:molecular chaperone TorD family protein [Azospirillum halopraeferens]